ncbi:hypothetical protein STANM309S_03660 [Streptomyces tanashiensis]
MKMSVVTPSCNGWKDLWACSLTRNHRVLNSHREVGIVVGNDSDDDAESTAEQLGLNVLTTPRTHVSGCASVRNDCIVPAAYPFAPGLGDTACRR